MRGTREAGRLRAGGGQFSLPLPNRPGSRCRGPSPAGEAGLVDTPSRRVLAAPQEEAPEPRLVLRGYKGGTELWKAYKIKIMTSFPTFSL